MKAEATKVEIRTSERPVVIAKATDNETSKAKVVKETIVTAEAVTKANAGKQLSAIRIARKVAKIGRSSKIWKKIFAAGRPISVSR